MRSIFPALVFLASAFAQDAGQALAEPSQLGSFDAGMLFVFNKGTAKVSTTF
jgi:hypothetical protein